MKLPRKERTISLWGHVCETYVNNPGLSTRDIAVICGTSHTHVQRIIRNYKGSGNSIIVVPSRVSGD